MPLPPIDPAHWLLRFSPSEWLKAGRHELALAAAALASRDQRQGVALARRAAGMALNAVLVLAPNEAWGRSYMDHLRVLSRDEAAAADLREAARQLCDAPLEGPRLVRIGGGGDQGLAAAATVVVSWCEAQVAASAD